MNKRKEIQKTQQQKKNPEKYVSFGLYYLNHFRRFFLFSFFKVPLVKINASKKKKTDPKWTTLYIYNHHISPRLEYACIEFLWPKLVNFFSSLSTMVSNHLAISSLLLLAMAFTSFLFVQPHLSSGRANPLKTCNFDKIYQLGDSLSDTGNLIRESQTGTSSAFASLPYGETYFENATGRCSNGLLMIDYIGM